jgi:hypothetical protein
MGLPSLLPTLHTVICILQSLNRKMRRVHASSPWNEIIYLLIFSSCKDRWERIYSYIPMLLYSYMFIPFPLIFIHSSVIARASAPGS